MNQLQDDKEVAKILKPLHKYAVDGDWGCPVTEGTGDCDCDIKKATKTLTELNAKRENRALIKGYDLGIQSWAEGKKRVKEIRKQLSSTTPKGKDE